MKFLIIIFTLFFSNLQYAFSNSDFVESWQRNAGNPQVDSRYTFYSDGQCLSEVINVATGSPVDVFTERCEYAVNANILTIKTLDSFFCNDIIGRYKISIADDILSLNSIKDNCHGRQKILSEGVWDRI